MRAATVAKPMHDGGGRADDDCVKRAGHPALRFLILRLIRCLQHGTRHRRQLLFAERIHLFAEARKALSTCIEMLCAVWRLPANQRHRAARQQYTAPLQCSLPLRAVFGGDVLSFPHQSSLILTIDLPSSQLHHLLCVRVSRYFITLPFVVSCRFFLYVAIIIQSYYNSKRDLLQFDCGFATIPQSFCSSIHCWARRSPANANCPHRRIGVIGVRHRGPMKNMSASIWQ